MYIFLDIDGVLITKDNPSEVLQFDPTCLKLFEQVIERHEHSTIIIASAWREVYSLEIIKSLFSKTVAAKILGTTPIISYPIECFRYQEILAYRQYHQLFTQPWIALDDKAEYYPTEAPVIITHAASGFDRDAAHQLDRFLAGKGPKTMYYIFLDIDGVLVKEEAPGTVIDLDEELKFDEPCLTLFETVIQKHEHSRIVISSSWREVFSLEAIKSYFSSPAVAAQVIGVTPQLSYPIQYFRHQEVLLYLKQQGLEAQPWIAIDDIAQHYPPDAPIIVTNAYVGFDEQAAKQLDRFLASTQNIPVFSMPAPPQDSEASAFIQGPLPPMRFNHEELLRDYGGYDVIQQEIEQVIERFIQIYYDNILDFYEDSALIEALEIQAAGAGASKFVFGVLGKSFDGEMPLVLGIRLYNSIDPLNESYDKRLVEVLRDEVTLYHLFKQHAQTSIDIKGIWTRFPVHEHLKPLISIEDRKLKQLLFNLGLNAITVGEFIVGYDGKKILTRDEFAVSEKIEAIIQMSTTLLHSWLSTVHHDEHYQLVGRTIVDLKPAQFVIQAEELCQPERKPAVIVDVGPAEYTDPILHCFKTANAMKELLLVFISEMLKQVHLLPHQQQQAKQSIYEAILAYLNACPNYHHLEHIAQPEFLSLIDVFKRKIKTYL